MKFSDIPAHEGVKNRLRALADDDRLPHALLLEGPEGTYKLALARAMAQYIHCSSPTPDGDSCGRCPSCLQHASMGHIDTLYVYPVVKTGTKTPISDDYAEDWRRFCEESPEADIELWTSMAGKRGGKASIYAAESASLLHKLSLTAHGARRRVIILWLPERIGEEGANKLLKLIEEPPGDDTMFLLVSDSSRDILPTIYSRTQRIEVSRLPDSVIADVLTSRGVGPAEASVLAHSADGNVVTALRAASRPEGARDQLERFMALMRLAYGRRVADLKTWASDLDALGREDVVHFYDYAARMIRENFMMGLGASSLCYMTTAEEEFSRRFAAFITTSNAEQLAEAFASAASDIAANANGKIVNFDTALKVCFLLRHR